MILSSRGLDKLFRLLIERTGLTADKIKDLTDEQILGIVPELRPNEDEAKKYEAIGKAVSIWQRDNPGKQPDYFADILPILGSINA